MKKVLLLFGMLAVVAGLIFLSSIDWTNIGGVDNTEGFENVTYGKIISKVDSLESQNFNKDLYEDILSKIEAAQEADLIDASQEDDLLELLNLKYLPKLVKATKDFFSSGCPSFNELNLYNGELRRFAEDYGDIVGEMRTATSSVYGAIGYTDQNGVRRGLDQEVVNFVNGVDFDINKANDLLSRIKGYEKQLYLSNCDIVKNSMNKNRERLSDFHYTMIAEEIKELWNLKARERMPNLADKIDDFEYMDYDNYSSSKSEELREKLDGY